MDKFVAYVLGGALLFLVICAVSGPAQTDQCARNADQNISRFDRTLRARYPNSATSARALQDQVEQLCRTGTPEDEAFATVMALIGGNGRR